LYDDGGGGREEIEYFDYISPLPSFQIFPKGSRGEKFGEKKVVSKEKSNRCHLMKSNRNDGRLTKKVQLEEMLASMHIER